MAGEETEVERGTGGRALAAAGCVAAAALLVAAALYWGPGLWAFFTDGDAVRAWVDAQGPLAPAAMGALVVAQIVVAVLPGEPVELAAGYLFGFWEGTAVCLAGGLVGTLAVTALVRALGMRAVRAFFSAEQLEGVSWLRDSARFELLMLVVFLIPGTPKDVLTYVAGLTSCRWWRIAAIATVGRIPSVVTSTLAAGFASRGDWVAAGATLAATLALVGAGAAAYAAVRRREAARQGPPGRKESPPAREPRGRMGGKPAGRRPMRARTAIAALLAATIALPLAGCFGLPGLDDVADQAEDFASQAQELADTLSSVDWGKVSRLVVRDARTGEVVRELTDQDQIEGAFDPLSDENGLAAEPDAGAEYAFELWQPETQKLGQSADDLDEVKVLEVTTYEGSPVVGLEVSPIGLRLHLTSRAAAESLSALAG